VIYHYKFIDAFYSLQLQDVYRSLIPLSFRYHSKFLERYVQSLSLSLLLKGMKFFTFVRRASSLSHVFPPIVVLPKVILHRVIFLPLGSDRMHPPIVFGPLRAIAHTQANEICAPIPSTNHARNRSRPTRSRTPTRPPYISSSPNPLLVLGEHRESL